jgi:hypothetical protein
VNSASNVFEVDFFEIYLNEKILNIYPSSRASALLNGDIKMKKIVIALAAAAFFTSGAMAKVISTHYSDSEAALLSGGTAAASSDVGTVTVEEFGAASFGGTASATSTKSGKSLVVSPHAQ